MQMMFPYLHRLPELCVDCWVSVRVTVESFLLSLMHQNLYGCMLQGAHGHLLVMCSLCRCKQISLLLYHLWHVISSNMNDRYDILNKMNSVCGKMNNLVCNFWKCDPFVKLKLLCNFCCDFYGSYLWDLSHPNIGGRDWGDCWVYHVGCTVLCCTPVWHVTTRIWITMSVCQFYE